jgi:pyruvate,water dikinase
MAGQYETILDVEGEDALFAAVQRCWTSINAPRTRAYQKQHGIDEADVVMAVVIQRLVPADHAGVLFTTNPHPGHFSEMLLEANWGLGESLVSGEVQPDSFRLDQKTGRVLAVICRQNADPASAQSDSDVSLNSSTPTKPCLRGIEIFRIWEAGQKAVEHFGCPQDIEWAIAGDQLFILQSRPITTLGTAAALETVLEQTQQFLRDQVRSGRGPWVLHNLAETLPHPTPLTWSVIWQFMSGKGGWGNLYRQAGFDPAPLVCQQGFLDLIAGRIYMDAARAPDLFFDDFPFGYDIHQLERSPDASQAAPTVARASWFRCFKAARRMSAAQTKLEKLSVDFDRRLRTSVFPEFVEFVAKARQTDWRAGSAEELITTWQQHEAIVLDYFAPQSLMPTLIAQMALGDLQSFLSEHFWDEDAEALSLELASGGDANSTVIADQELHEVGCGSRSRETWLAEHGHRATQEFDLASPRYREQPEVITQLAERLAQGESPLTRHRHHVEKVNQRIQQLRGRLTRSARRELDARLMLVRRYAPFREDSKHFLMLGYDLLRELALEAGRRLEIDSDVFFLTRDELFDSLRVGYAPLHVIRQRKRTHQAELYLDLPRVIDRAAIASIGQPGQVVDSSDGHQALAVSAGKAVGPARIVSSPDQTEELGTGYILVCPTTDPSWTPLFVNAAGLVVERGGSLSHGAVVARELGLPAVVLPGATRQFTDGEMLRVDGFAGYVGRAAEQEAEIVEARANDPENVVIAPGLIPPGPGTKDRRTARFRNLFALLWAIYLLAFFCLPAARVRQPSLAACDWLLWPLVRVCGKPTAVALIAGMMAALVLIVQRLATDNPRLLEAKRRARLLTQQAQALPQGSARQVALLGQAARVTPMTLQAAMAPVGLMLGLLILPFVWFQERVDPTRASPPAGSAVQVVALIQADWHEPVELDALPNFQLDDATPRARTLVPLRPTLERLLVLLRQPREVPGEPWEFKFLPDPGREQAANDLEAFLAAGIPPQGITWLLRPADNADGSFPISVSTPGHPPIHLHSVLGDSAPPTATEVKEITDSPIREVHVVCPRPQSEPIFWRPFASLSVESNSRFAGWLRTLNISWLWLYVGTYIVSLLLIKRLLRIP